MRCAISLLLLCAAVAPAASLSDHTAAAVLEAWAARHAQVEVSVGSEIRVHDYAYLLIAASGEALSGRWPGGGAMAVNLGSLLKPFCALAYAHDGRSRYPRFECKGIENGCWSPAPHGTVDLSGAVADSCNAYFRRLARLVSPTAMEAVASRYGLPAPPLEARPEEYWGLGRDWKIPPVSLIRAYQELLRPAAGPHVALLREGMAEAARRGTAKALNGRGWAKTGTAACAHAGEDRRLPARSDGYALVASPAPSPRMLLLVQLHGATGRMAAEAAARMLDALEAAP